MKTEREFGYEYAAAMQGEPGFDGPVVIDIIVQQSLSIPSDDYTAMKRGGINNPNAREYWKGFNSFFKEAPNA